MQRVWTFLLAMSATALFLLIAPVVFARLGDIDVIRKTCLVITAGGGALFLLYYIMAAHDLPRHEMKRLDHLLFIGSGTIISTIAVFLFFAFKDVSILAMLGFGLVLALTTVFCGKKLQEATEEAAKQKEALLERANEIVRDQQAPLQSAKGAPFGYDLHIDAEPS